MTGRCTISLSLANNASNGIEPSFAHHYFRNVIREGKKSKEKIDVYSFELLAYRELVNSKAQPLSTVEAEKLPAYFISSDGVTPKEHVDVQAAAQGPGAIELIENGSPAYRAVYSVKYLDTVFVLHAFEKTTNGVDHKEMATAAKRYKEMKERVDAERKRAKASTQGRK